MKKIITLVMLLLVGSLIFAQSPGLSAGVGLTVSPMQSTAEGDKLFSRTPIGAKVFVDATFIEASVGIEFSNELKFSTVTFDDFSATSLTLSLLGKLPIDLGSLVLSPMAGITYMRTLTFNGDGFDINDLEDEDRQFYGLDRLWLNIGVSADFPISPTMYLRASGLFGYGLNNDTEKLLEDAFDETIINTRWDFGVSVGFRF
jgi:hypothetical protein